MPVRKISIALDEQVAADAARLAAERGTSVSALINEALVERLAIADGLAAVAEWEAENGALTPEELARAEAILDAHGVGVRA